MRILLGRVKGDKGDTGSQGPRGPRGERGPQGPPGEPGQTDIYTRAESDARYQAKGESIDFQELARRIPSWRWKVTLPKTTHQTVTATVGRQTYTSDFYAQQGSDITFYVRPNTADYVPGEVSPKSATLDKDLTVTVTAASSKNVAAGAAEITSDEEHMFMVPQKVHVLKLTFGQKTYYAKVNSGDRFIVMIDGGYYIIRANKNNAIAPYTMEGLDQDHITASWSTEINEHPFDYDWSKPI